MEMESVLPVIYVLGLLVTWGIGVAYNTHKPVHQRNKDWLTEVFVLGIGWPLIIALSLIVGPPWVLLIALDHLQAWIDSRTSKP